MKSTTSRSRLVREDKERREDFSLRFPRNESNFHHQETRGERRREVEEKKENVGEREIISEKEREERKRGREEKKSVREIVERGGREGRRDGENAGERI